MEMRFYLHSDIADIGLRSAGVNRIIANVVDGFIKVNKSNVEAQVLTPGGDWPLVNQESNCVYIDARARAKTDQGEIYIKYTGRLVIDQGTKKLLEKAPDAQPTAFGDTDWFTMLNVETTDPRLKWLENAALIGQGRWHIDEKGLAAEYLVYQLKN